jgi:hypothetical protein
VILRVTYAFVVGSSRMRIRVTVCMAWVSCSLRCG